MVENKPKVYLTQGHQEYGEESINRLLIQSISSEYIGDEENIMLIVKKFGGTSVGNSERIKNVANRIAKEYQKGNDVVVVLSAGNQRIIGRDFFQKSSAAGGITAMMGHLQHIHRTDIGQLLFHRFGNIPGEQQPLAAVFHQLGVAAAVLTFAGVVFGIFLHRFVIDTVEIDMIMFGKEISLESYFFSIVLTLFFAKCP